MLEINTICMLLGKRNIKSHMYVAAEVIARNIGEREDFGFLVQTEDAQATIEEIKVPALATMFES